MIPCSNIDVSEFRPNLAECASQNSSEKFRLISIFGNKKPSRNADFIPALNGFEACKKWSIFASINHLNFTGADTLTQTNAETL